jgi:hypothetical protein
MRKDGRNPLVLHKPEATGKECAVLVAKPDYWHGKEYHTAQLCQEHIDVIKRSETGRSFLPLANDWLERMPLFDSEKL